jgi:hypothetical protein
MSLLLTDAHNEQLMLMLKDGKNFSEITEHFKTAYQISLPYHRFAYAKQKLDKGGAASFSPGPDKKKRNYKRKDNVAAPGENIVKEIVTMLADIHSGYDKIFKHLRLELIKSRAQVYDMMKGAEIESESGE